MQDLRRHREDGGMDMVQTVMLLENTVERWNARPCWVGKHANMLGIRTYDGCEYGVPIWR